MTSIRNTNSPAIDGEVRRCCHDVGHGSIHRSDALNIAQIFMPSNFCANVLVDRRKYPLRFAQSSVNGLH